MEALPPPLAVRGAQARAVPLVKRQPAPESKHPLPPRTQRLFLPKSRFFPTPALPEHLQQEHGTGPCTQTPCAEQPASSVVGRPRADGTARVRPQLQEPLQSETAHQSDGNRSENGSRRYRYRGGTGKHTPHIPLEGPRQAGAHQT